MKIQIIEVRTGIFGIPRKINAVQGDSGRILRCKVTDMSIPSGSTARICARKPSGAKVYNSCNISGNTVEVELTTQMLAEIGKTQAQIEVTYSGKRITTFKFVIDVEECLVDNSSIESTNEFTALEKALADTAADSNIAQKTVVFSQASTRSLPVSGENIATIIGKIKKYLTDLGTAAFQNIANNLTTTAAGSVLDARQGKALQDQISSLNTKISTNGFVKNPNDVKTLMAVANGWASDKSNFPSEFTNAYGELITTWVYSGSIGLLDSTRKQVLTWDNYIAQRNYTSSGWSDWTVVDLRTDASWVSAWPIYYRRKNGIVFVNGDSTNGEKLPANTYTTVYTLPSEYAPSTSIKFICSPYGNNQTIIGQILTNGSIQLYPVNFETEYWAFNVTYPIK